MGTVWKETSDPLLFEKELLPVGEIVPFVNAKHEVPLVEVEESYIDNLITHFKKFKELGIRVPLFKSHVEDADNDRGTIVALQKKNNQKGVKALFAKIKFNDKNAAKRGVKVDVSIHAPERFRDGKGNVYLNALRHVALTSKPIVPGLEKWTGPLICSFDTPSGLMLANDPAAKVKPPAPSGDKMSELIDQILEALGLSAPDGSDDMAKLRVILHDANGGGDAAGAGSGDLNLAFPPVLFNQMKKARETEIDGLVRDNVLTAARGVEWKKKYCTSEALQVDLKLSEGTTETEFDRMVSAAQELAKDRPLATQGRTLLKLSQDGEDGKSKDNPMTAAVKKLNASRQRTA